MPQHDRTLPPQLRVWLAKSPRRAGWLFAATGTLLGLGLVLVGALAPWDEGSDYAQSLCAHFGVAIAVFAPLLAYQRVIERGVEQARNETESLRRTVDDRLIGRSSGRRDRQEGSLNRAAEGIHKDFVESYNAAAAGEGIDPQGFRIPMGHEDLYLHVVVLDDQVGLYVETADDSTADAKIVAGDVWTGDRNVDDVLDNLEEGLSVAGRSPGYEAFTKLRLWSALVGALRGIADSQDGHDGALPVRPEVSEVVGDWAITRDGVDSLRAPNVRVDADKILHLSGPSREAVLEQVRAGHYNDQAFRTALHDAERRERARAEAQLKEMHEQFERLSI